MNGMGGGTGAVDKGYEWCCVASREGGVGERTLIVVVQLQENKGRGVAVRLTVATKGIWEKKPQERRYSPGTTAVTLAHPGVH